MIDNTFASAATDQNREQDHTAGNDWHIDLYEELADLHELETVQDQEPDEESNKNAANDEIERPQAGQRQEMDRPLPTNIEFMAGQAANFLRHIAADHSINRAPHPDSIRSFEEYMYEALGRNPTPVALAAFRNALTTHMRMPVNTNGNFQLNITPCGANSYSITFSRNAQAAPGACIVTPRPR